jgi:hypothetical protein
MRTLNDEPKIDEPSFKVRTIFDGFTHNSTDDERLRKTIDLAVINSDDATNTSLEKKKKSIT